MGRGGRSPGKKDIATEPSTVPGAISFLPGMPKQLKALPGEFYRVLVAWFFEYPHNNLLHKVFFEFVLVVLRSNQKAPLAQLLQDIYPPLDE